MLFGVKSGGVVIVTKHPSLPPSPHFDNVSFGQIPICPFSCLLHFFFIAIIFIFFSLDSKLIAQVYNLITYLFEQLSQRLPVEQNRSLSVEDSCKAVFNIVRDILDPSTSGSVNIFELKILLMILCQSSYANKLRYIFTIDHTLGRCRLPFMAQLIVAQAEPVGKNNRATLSSATLGGY